MTVGSDDQVLVEIRDLLADSNRLLGELLDTVRTPTRLMWNQQETAERLGVSVRLIQSARASGRLRESGLFPGKVLFSQHYLDGKLAEFDGDAFH